jgi:predicted DNA-binding transcriptional regulator AlpA
VGHSIQPQAVRRLLQLDEFPEPIRLRAGKLVWRESVVVAYIDSRGRDVLRSPLPPSG